MTVSSYNDFSTGLVKDPTPGVLPPSAVSSAVNVFFDVPSKVRPRNVTRKPSGSPAPQTASAVMIGVGGGAGRNGYLYGIKTDGTVQIFVGGIATNLSSSWGSPQVVGRSTQFFGIALFPTMSDAVQSFVPAVYRADNSGFNSYNPPAATVATVTAGSSAVTFSNGDFLANTQGNGGQFVVITDNASSSTRNIYIGTFQASAAHTIIVDPIPTKSFTATQGTGTGAFVTSTVPAFGQAANPNTVYSYGAQCAATHQNRVLLGNVRRFNTSSSQIEMFPRSVFYTILPDAKSEQPSQNVNAQGHAWIFREGIEPNNRFDIGGSDPILALAPIGDNELLIFTQSQAWRLSGYLTTRISNDAGGITYDVHPVPNSPGLWSERSVQQTPHGLVFAGRFDLFLYAGGRFEPLLGRANSLYWKNLMTNGTILGSHMLNDDFYVISVGTDHSVTGEPAGVGTTILCYHLPTRTLSNLSGATLALFHAVPDPADPRGHVGLRWWDTTLAAPSMTGTQIIYTSDVTNPGATGGFDADGLAIAESLVTRVYDEGAPDQAKRFWRTVWRALGSPVIKVEPVETILGSGSPKSVGTFTGANGFASYTGPVLQSRGVQYSLDNSADTSLTFEFYGFDHYYDAIAYAKAS